MKANASFRDGGWPNYEKIKVEYNAFCDGNEFNLDRYLGLRYKDPALEVKSRRRVIKRRKVKKKVVENDCSSVEIEQEERKEFTTKELLKLRQSILVAKIPQFVPRAEDTKPIAQAIQSNNHMKIYAGLSAFKNLIESVMKEQTQECNPKNLESRRFLLEEIISGKSTFIKQALLRKLDPEEVEYHEMGFEILLDLFHTVLQYPLMFKPGTAE